MANSIELQPIETNKTVDKLEVNDWVIFDNGRRDCELLQVCRTTNTQICVKVNNMASQEFERKFAKKDGFEVGLGNNVCHFPRIKPFTKKSWDEVIMDRKYNAVYRVFPMVTKEESQLNRFYNFLISEKIINPISEF